jgi:hypothetical protein
MRPTKVTRLLAVAMTMTLVAMKPGDASGALQ